MPVSLTCDCGKQLRAADEHKGKKVKCPGCGASLMVPGTKPKSSVAAPSLDVGTPKNVTVRPDKLTGHTEWVLCVACSPDGRYALTGSSDKTARLWDIQSGKEVQCLKLPDSVYGVAFSGDGEQAFTVDRQVRVWETRTWKELRHFPASGYTFAFSQDGRRLLSADRATIELWDVEKGESLLMIEGQHINDGGATMREFLERLLMRLQASKLELIGGAPSVPGHIAQVRGLAFSPDCRYALSASGEFAGDNLAPVDCTARVWDLRNGREIQRFRGHASWVFSVACSPDGRLALTGSDDSTIRFWSLERRLFGLLPPPARPIRTIKRHEYQVNCVRFSPDGHRAVSVSSDSIRLWDVARGKEIACFEEPHQEGIEDIAFSPDGRFVLTASQDKTIGIWDVSSEKQGTRPQSN